MPPTATSVTTVRTVSYAFIAALFLLMVTLRLAPLLLAVLFGYFILDTRDRMAYGELMACVLFIGLLGFLLDWLARLAHRRWSGA